MIKCISFFHSVLFGSHDGIGNRNVSLASVLRLLLENTKTLTEWGSYAKLLYRRAIQGRSIVFEPG